MKDQASDFAGQLAAVFTVTVTWLGSQSAASWVAGGAGGLVRWGITGKKAVSFWKWVGSGFMQVFGGAITAHFGWPIALVTLEKFTGDLGDPGVDPQSVATASFLAGALGISAMRVLWAFIETRGKNVIETKVK